MSGQLRAIRSELTIECECGEEEVVDWEDEEITGTSIHFACSDCGRRIFAYADGIVEYESDGAS